MESGQFILLLLCVLSLGLLVVNFFRFNILFVLASIFVNIGITQQPGVPKWLFIAAVLIALGEAMAGFAKLVFGKKNNKRYVG